jgi:hypothetical protein
MSYYQQGQWNADCDQCGVKFKSSQLRKQWNGLYTCPKCWEPRQPQDFVRAVKDGSPPAYVRGGAFSPTVSNIVFPLTATEVEIIVEDGSIFPDAPFFANIQDDNEQEMVLVLWKNQNNLYAQRGYNCLPRAWP